MLSLARRAAYRILLDIERGKTDLPQGLARERADLGEVRDQALASEIAIGTLRWRGLLDHVIQHFTGKRLAGFDSEVVVALRLGAYQLLYLTRVPPSAVVDDSVELTRSARKQSATGLVNAVLRRIAAERGDPPLPKMPHAGAGNDALADYYSVILSHPRWYVARLLGRYGEAATREWLRFNNEEAPLVLRANRLKTTAPELSARLAERGVLTKPARFAPDALEVTAGNPLRTPLEPEGLFILQDEASQLVGELLPVHAGDRVLDACASPGGKTTELAARMEDRGLLVASDVRPRRVALLASTVARAGARSVRVIQADFTGTPPFGSTFDAVLLDAPCSGLGTLRRDPDIKWRRREDDLAPLAAAELRMLLHACEAVRPGGHLLYATCSSEPDENEDVVSSFLSERPDFEPRPLAEVSGRSLHPFRTPAGHFRSYPHVHGLEAFFACLMSRRR